MDGIFDSLDFARVAGALLLIYFALPFLARRIGDPEAGPSYSDVVPCFLEACLFLEIASIILGNWRLCFAGFMAFLILGWLLVTVAFAAKRRWIWDPAEWRMRVLRGLEWWESGRWRQLGPRLAAARERSGWTQTSLLMAFLLGCALVERSWFAIDSYRFAGSVTYQRALSLQTLVHGGAWALDGSVALLAPLCLFSGVYGSTVIRFAGPLFALMLTLSGGYCAWVYSHRFSAAFVACGLLAVYPSQFGLDSPGELAGPEMACVFWVLAVAMLKRSWKYSLGAAGLALMINQQFTPVLAGSFFAILAALLSARVARAFPAFLSLPARLGACVFFAILLLRPLSLPGESDGPFQYESAARVTAGIARNFPRNRWIIISPAQEVALTYGRGWHVELAEFVREYTPEEMSRPHFRFPYTVNDVFVFIEKEPLRQAARGAASTSDDYSYQYFTRAGRMSLEFQAARMMAAYCAGHNDATVYYEDPRIMVYRVTAATN